MVVGLGNPGREYEKTRHNMGFMLIDRLAQALQTQVKREECRALIGRGDIAGHAVELIKPQTFMNLSGESVACLLKKDGRSLDRLIVISDDLALPFGRIRLRAKGSHGGQNGLRNIIDRTGTNEFIRLRVGIQPIHTVTNASRYVLDEMSKTETARLNELMDLGVDAVKSIIADGLERAMATYNADKREAAES